MIEYQIDYLGNKKDFFDSLVSLWLMEWGSSTKKAYIEAKKKKYRERLSTTNPPFVLVAFEGNELIGSAGLSNHDLEKRPDLSPWLVGVLVRPEFRNHGVASSLIAEVIDKARRLGYERLYLHTEKAQGLYEKLGWHFLEHTINDMGEESDVYYLDI